MNFLVYKCSRYCKGYMYGKIISNPLIFYFFLSENTWLGWQASNLAQFFLCSKFLSGTDLLRRVLFLFHILVLCKCCNAPEALLFLFPPLFTMLEGTPYPRILSEIALPSFTSFSPPWETSCSLRDQVSKRMEYK